MIMDKFDEKKKGFWSYEEWNEFCSYTSQGGDGKVESDEELEQFFKEEFDIALSKKDGRFVVSLEDIENMYGGFQYNDVNALAEDADALDSAGITNTGILE
ncbi:hypothetical protein AGDE_04384 [Angomonas deanei]|nr:hypothetical protein AGDE_04384 [Angomonas deanei]|eukprot:EPY39544.1 hypothetical protein AGDE_04384 [Angomonas deanei]